MTTVCDSRSPLTESSSLLLAASYPTLTAWEQPVAQMFADNITALCRQDDEFRMAVWLCVHEAVVNAVVHGNLEIPTQGDSLQAMDDLHRNIATSIRDNTFALRRVALVAYRNDSHGTLRVEVTDQGQGDVVESAHKTRLGSGRGQQLMRNLAMHAWYDETRRTQVLEFTIRSR